MRIYRCVGRRSGVVSQFFGHFIYFFNNFNGNPLNLNLNFKSSLENFNKFSYESDEFLTFTGNILNSNLKSSLENFNFSYFKEF